MDGHLKPYISFYILRKCKTAKFPGSQNALYKRRVDGQMPMKKVGSQKMGGFTFAFVRFLWQSQGRRQPSTLCSASGYSTDNGSDFDVDDRRPRLGVRSAIAERWSVILVRGASTFGFFFLHLAFFSLFFFSLHLLPNTILSSQIYN